MTSRMTVRQVAERLNKIIAENPGVADLPFVVKRKVNRRRTEYIPMTWISSATLSLQGKVHVVEATCVDELFVFDKQTGLRTEPVSPKSY